VTYEVSDRPYPSSFGLYELELYLAVHQCAGLARGIYHYDPSAHALTRIDYDAEQFEERLDDARVAAGVPGRPAVLIFVTARIGRLARQFCSVAYATTLRHAGLLQATLHLVATAMRMSPAVASLGDGEMSSRVLGLDWPAEVNVGEFLVGVPGRQSTGPLGE
jgi:SagB-type dehydrogenase family enzyme